MTITNRQYSDLRSYQNAVNLKFQTKQRSLEWLDYECGTSATAEWDAQQRNVRGFHEMAIALGLPVRALRYEGRTLGLWCPILATCGMLNVQIFEARFQAFADSIAEDDEKKPLAMQFFHVEAVQVLGRGRGNWEMLTESEWGTVAWRVNCGVFRTQKRKTA